MNDRAFISLLDCVFNGRPIKKKDEEKDVKKDVKKDGKRYVKTRKASRKELVVVEVDINDMWKRATDVAFERLQSPIIPVSNKDLLDLVVPFGNPDKMRCSLRDSYTAHVLLGDQYNQVAKLMEQRDPFVIVIRSDNDVYAVANLLEDID
jgi:uncharacterized protein (DUF2235 family)